MNKDFNNKILECFFIVENNPNQISVYDYTISEINIEFLRQSIIYTNNENIKYIKSWLIILGLNLLFSLLMIMKIVVISLNLIQII